MFGIFKPLFFDSGLVSQLSVGIRYLGGCPISSPPDVTPMALAKEALKETASSGFSRGILAFSYKLRKILGGSNHDNSVINFSFSKRMVREEASRVFRGQIHWTATSGRPTEIQAHAVRIKIRRSAKGNITTWQKELASREEEVIQSLRNEGVWSESYFREMVEDDTYLVGFMKGKDISKSARIARRSKLPIDKFHRKFKKDSFEEVVPLMGLYSKTFTSTNLNAPFKLACHRAEVSRTEINTIKKMIQNGRLDEAPIDLGLGSYGLSLFIEDLGKGGSRLWIFSETTLLATTEQNRSLINLIPLETTRKILPLELLIQFDGREF